MLWRRGAHLALYLCAELGENVWVTRQETAAPKMSSRLYIYEGRHLQRPREAAGSGVPASKQEIQELGPQRKNIPRLLQQRVDEHILPRIGGRMLRVLQALPHHRVDKLVDGAASAPEPWAANEPVEVPEPPALGQVVLCDRERLRKVRLLGRRRKLMRLRRGVERANGPAEEEERGRVEGEAEEERLQVDRPAFRDEIHELLDRVLDLAEVRRAVGGELRAQKIPRVLPRRPILREDAVAQEREECGAPDTEPEFCATVSMVD